MARSQATLRMSRLKVLPGESVHKMAKIVRGQDREFLSGSQEARKKGMHE